MHDIRTKRIDDRIVNIYQPHVRPTVRGKEKAKGEFGSKLQVSMVKGSTFIDHLSWAAFNEGQYLKISVENDKKRFGFYPAEVLGDQIYFTQENRKLPKDLGIKLFAKPLGRRPSTAVAVHLSPGERNPIEGKFGQAKIAYGLYNIKAKLEGNSRLAFYDGFLSNSICRRRYLVFVLQHVLVIVRQGYSNLLSCGFL